MPPELTEEQKRLALTPPPARPERPRVDRGSNQRQTQQAQSFVVASQSFQAVSGAPSPSGMDATQRLAKRTAEQAFLPLVSKLVKLNEQIEEVQAALTYAIAVGVNPQGLQIELTSIAFKGNLGWHMVPESIRKLLEPAPAEPEQPRNRRQRPEQVAMRTGGGAVDEKPADSAPAGS